MGKSLTIKVRLFSMGWKISPASKPKARGFPLWAEENHLLRIHAAGNKSDGLLLTIRALIRRRGDERFTIGRAESAVQNATAGASGRS